MGTNRRVGIDQGPGIDLSSTYTLNQSDKRTFLYSFFLSKVVVTPGLRSLKTTGRFV